MVLEGRMEEQFRGFCHIFGEVSRERYSDKQKVEMLELLEQQTLQQLLAWLEEGRGQADLVWHTVQAIGGRDFVCKELFLRIFDRANELFEARQVKEVVVETRNTFNSNINQGSNTNQCCRNNENMKRKVDSMKEENVILKNEIEDKVKNLCETEDHFRNLQQRFRRLTEAFARLEGENSDLKSTVENVTEEKKLLKEKSVAKEAALKDEICSLTAIVEERGLEVGELAREQEAALAELDLLAEEVAERDLVIGGITARLEEAELRREEVQLGIPRGGRIMEEVEVSTPRGGSRREALPATPVTLSFVEAVVETPCLGEELEQARDAWEEEERREMEAEHRRSVERRSRELRRVAERLGKLEVELGARVRSTEACLGILQARTRGRTTLTRWQGAQRNPSQENLPNLIATFRHRVERDGGVARLVFSKHLGVRVS